MVALKVKALERGRTKQLSRTQDFEAALERGQKIDDLVSKSNDLSGSSKMFYKTAKKQNQCCSYM